MSRSVLARYKPQGVLGAGPLGKIYTAVDRSTGARVAFRGFKRPADAGEADWKGAIDRFTRELQAARRLEHPAIARVFDFGEDQGLYYVVTEWIDGEPLHARLENGERFSPDEALRLIGLAGRAVEYAGEMGAAHGDLTPFNLILSRDGGLKVVNYGLASCRPKQDSIFRSPEELLGHEPSSRSDLFALGLLLHTMIEGAHPFWSGSVEETQARILHAPPPPAASAPPYVQAIIGRLLARNAGDRYATWGEVAADVMAGRAPAAPPQRRLEVAPPAEPPAPSLSQFRLNTSDVLEIKQRLEKKRQAEMERRRSFGGCGARFGAGVLLAVLAGVSVMNRAGEHRVIVASAAGRADLQAGNGIWRPVRAGEELRPGARLRTSEGSTVTLAVGDGSRIQVAPGSLLTVSEAGFRSGSRKRARVFLLSRGEALARVRRRPNQYFAVETPAAAAVARGAEFGVSYRRGLARIVTRAGAVQARNDHGSQAVPAGFQVTAAGGKSPPRASALAQDEAAELTTRFAGLAAGGTAERLAGMLRSIDDAALTGMLDMAQGLASPAGPQELTLKQGSARARALGAMQALVRAMELGDGEGNYPAKLNPRTLGELGGGADMAAGILAHFKGKKLVSYSRMENGYEIRARVDSEEAPLIIARNSKITIADD